jgi:hypothetical protein
MSPDQPIAAREGAGRPEPGSTVAAARNAFGEDGDDLNDFVVSASAT